MMVLEQVLPSETDITRLKSIAQTKQKLQAHAICNGVTSFRDKDETKFIFDPYVGGKPFGPYVLRMKFPRYFGQFPQAKWTLPIFQTEGSAERPHPAPCCAHQVPLHGVL